MRYRPDASDTALRCAPVSTLTRYAPELVERVIGTVRTNLFEGGILVVAVLFAFLGNLRAAMIVAFYVALCFAATHLPVPDVSVPQSLLGVPIDKIAHFSMYSLLGFLLSWMLSMRTVADEQTASRTWFHSLLVLTIVGLYGMFDETTQPAFGRTFDMLDWTADMIGAVCGILAFLAARRLLRHYFPVPEPLPTVVYMGNG
jgi:VanZ family protein